MINISPCQIDDVEDTNFHLQLIQSWLRIGNFRLQDFWSYGNGKNFHEHNNIEIIISSRFVSQLSGIGAGVTNVSVQSN